MPATLARTGYVVLGILVVLLVTHGLSPIGVTHVVPPTLGVAADAGPGPCGERHGGVHDAAAPDSARPAGLDETLGNPVPAFMRLAWCSATAPSADSPAGPALVVSAAVTVVRLGVLRR